MLIYILYWTAQSGFFIIINTLRIYNSCSLPPLDQECIAKAILSCTTHSNTTSWQQARGRPFTAALFSQQHYFHWLQVPKVTSKTTQGKQGIGSMASCLQLWKITGVWGPQKVSTSPEGISGCFLTNYLLRMERKSKGKRNTSLSLPMRDENITQIRQHVSNFTVQLLLTLPQHILKFVYIYSQAFHIIQLKF